MLKAQLANVRETGLAVPHSESRGRAEHRAARKDECRIRYIEALALNWAQRTATCREDAR